MGLQIRLKNKILERVVELVGEKDSVISALIISSESVFLKKFLYTFDEKCVNLITIVSPCVCQNNGSKRSCICSEEELCCAKSKIRELSRDNDIVISIEGIKFKDIVLMGSLPPESVDLLKSIYDTYSLTLDRLNKIIGVADAIWGEEQGDYRDVLEEAVKLCISTEFNHASKYKGTGICQKN